MNRSGLAVLAALLLTSCGGPLLFVEVEIPDLQVTLPEQSFPAFNAPNPADWCNPAQQTNPPCVARGASYDIGQQVPAFNDKGVTTELRLKDLAFALSATQSAGAPADLAGIQSATLRVLDPGGTGAGTVIASYTRASVSPPPTSVAISGNANIDLAPYLRSGVLPLRVEVVIDGSTSAFKADIHASFYARVKLDWGTYL